MRNSDPDAAIYWLCRMLDGGEDPLYIARRLVRFASEDIGMADSGALQIAVSCYQACHFLGMPECDVHLTHAVTYLSMASKSMRFTLHAKPAKRFEEISGGAGSAASVQRSDRSDERAGLRQRVSVCPQYRRKADCYVLSAGFRKRPYLLSSHRSGTGKSGKRAALPD